MSMYTPRQHDEPVLKLYKAYDVKRLQKNPVAD